MQISWSIPFPDELPEAVRERILEKTQTRWERMTAAYTGAVVTLHAGSEWDPQDPEFLDLPGNKAAQSKLRKQLLQAASEIAQRVAMESSPGSKTSQRGMEENADEALPED